MARMKDTSYSSESSHTHTAPAIDPHRTVPVRPQTRRSHAGRNTGGRVTAGTWRGLGKRSEPLQLCNQEEASDYHPTEYCIDLPPPFISLFIALATSSQAHFLSNLQELRIACSVAQREVLGGVSPVVSPLAQVRTVASGQDPARSGSRSRSEFGHGLLEGLLEIVMCVTHIRLGVPTCVTP